MGLEVIGAGLGRNATLSMKFALEKLGFGKCHHMIEVMANARRQIPLWLDAGAGRPDWEAIFAGYRSCTDYPSASHWRALANHYPQAKVVLTTRNPDDWFDSVSETIFSPRMTDGLEGSPMAQLMADNGKQVAGMLDDKCGHARLLFLQFITAADIDIAFLGAANDTVISLSCQYVPD